MSGGKGGSQTSSVQIPEYIEAAAQRNLNKAERISQIPYAPQYGPDVAAFTPMQQAGFQGTAQVASAFGVPGGGMSQRDIMGGMDAPMRYAGGVQGYSSAPIFQQSLDELARQRPAQKSYIDSFFIDPTSGQYASQPMDYTQYATAAETGRQQAQADRDNALAIAQAQAAAGPTTTIQNTTLTPVELQQYASTVGGANYNPSTDLRSTVDASGTYNVPDTTTEQRVAAEDLAMNVLGNANNNIVDDARGLFNSEPSFDNPSSSGSYGGSLVTGGLSGDFTPVPGVYGNIADNVVSNVAPGYAMDQQGQDFAATMGSTQNPDGTYDISSWFNDSGPVAQPSGGGDGGGGGDREDTFGSDLGRSLTDPSYDPPGNVVSRTLGVGAGADDSGASGGDGCVVATHAVNSGAFTPNMKREAVVWCMNVLHDKWWGEAVRRGYRYLGRKKIEQGKAREHYAEFRRYIDFASGKKRTARGAATFALRTAQFFAVGLIKRDA